MKTIVLLLGTIALGLFVYNNFRGARSAVMPAVGNIVETVKEKNKAPAINQTDFPLALPDGFSISIYAKDLGGPRVLAFDPSGTVIMSITGQGKVVAVMDADGNGLTEATGTVANGLKQPHGLAFGSNGKLYIAETDQVAMYDYDSFEHKASNKKKIIDLPGGGNHFSRTIGFGQDGKLYIAIGSTCNVCVENNSKRAKILVANADGSDLKEYASGLRNSVFFTWHPQTQEMWATDMGRDLIGDNIPPDEVNIVKYGNFYGWPYCYGKNIQDNSFKPTQSCQNAIPSHIDFQAHSAPLGLAFIPDSWPAQYRDDLLIAYHGSWNRTVPTGYKIVRAKLDAQGNYEGTEDFISGWLANDGALGRPVDLLFGPDGSLYISDDKAGVIYRVIQT